MFTKSTLRLMAAFAAPILAQEDYYFTMGTGMPVVLERVDPLLSAGRISNHVHSVVGGNGFAPTMDFAQTQTSSCSTVPVIPDKSNYWMPALYYKSPHNDSFIRVPEKPDHKIYYKYGTGGRPDLEKSEFPKEFRMITGNAMLRSDDGSSDISGNELNWQCHQPNYVTPTGTGFPKFTSCSDGLAATIRFPSCWNGQAFNPASPHAHMAFPSAVGGLAGCTAPFNVKRFPEIMIEYWLDVSSFDGDYSMDDSPWTLSMGDNTGYGFHADFINGWEVGRLQSAMKTCRIGNTNLPLDSDTCFGAGSVRSGDVVKNCRVANIVPEDVGLAGGEASNDNEHQKTRGGVIPHLPGCNPIQPGPGLASVQTNCPYSLPTGFGSGAALGSQSGAGDTGSSTGASSAASVAPTGTSSSTKTNPTTMATSASTAAAEQPSSASIVDQTATSVTSQSTATSATGSPSEGATSTGSSSSGSTLTASDGSAWSLSGCYTDQLNPVRSLGTQSEWWGQQITASNCVDRCAKLGMPLSGTENSGQCFCGAKLVGSKKAASSECNMPCKGDSSQTCGGPARLSLYKKSSAGSKKQRTNRHLARHVEAVS